MRWRPLVLLTLALSACQSPRCEAHGDPFVSRRVPILYGLIDPPGDRRTTYPHADLVLGGCVVDDDSPAETVRRCCDTCCEVYDALREGTTGPRRSFFSYEERDPLLDGR